MVKNTHGGSGHKKFARKHTTGQKSNKLRVSEDEGEIYAIVTKMLGNGMFHCYCIDGIIRLGHIRGKFTGRGKRDNMVETAKWILIGLREWDVPSEKSSTISKGKHKIQQCDLLEVYSDIDKLRLRESVPEDWNILDSNDVSKIDLGLGNDTGNDFIFGTDRDFERDRLIQEMQSSTAERITLQVGESKEGDVVAPTEEEINIDDI
jgi:translation initiation factor 1A